MKILAFTDPHGNIDHAKAIAKKVTDEHPDAIVCSGDFSLSGERYESFLDEIWRLGKPVYFVTGNHEGEDFRLPDRFSFMKDIGFQAVDLGEFVLAGIPGSLEFWPGERVDSDTVDLVLSLLSNADRTKPMVFLTHFPPMGCGVDGARGGAQDAGGSATVRKIVEKLRPETVITGHYHVDFGGRGKYKGSTVINPGPEGELLTVSRLSG